MKNEGDVKKLVKAALASWSTEIWWFMPSSNGFGTPGIPDFICAYRGYMLPIETKFGQGTQTPWQKKQAALLSEAMTPYWIVDEKTVLEFPNKLKYWMAQCS